MTTLTPWSDDRNQIQARVLADSISEAGCRLTTQEVTYWRPLVAEANTHRVGSRNSESSRAVPFHKRVNRVREWPYIPVWEMEQPGMSGAAMTDDAAMAYATAQWLLARDEMVVRAQNLANAGIHKGKINRLLEPWCYHTMVFTATDWEGFWEQRVHPAADSDFFLAAQQMKLAYDASEPKLLRVGEWHLPLIFDEDWGQVAQSGMVALGEDMTPVIKKISAARMARTSYLTHDGKRDIEADLRLFDDLTVRDGSTPRRQVGAPVHWSPLEHVATPCVYTTRGGIHGPDGKGCRPGTHRGNFTGFDQFRHEVEARS